MIHGDTIFIKDVTDPIQKGKSIARWKSYRVAFLITCCAFFLAALIFYMGERPGLSSLFAGASVLQMGAYVWLDLMIKIALLVEEIE